MLRQNYNIDCGTRVCEMVGVGSLTRALVLCHSSTESNVQPFLWRWSGRKRKIIDSGAKQNTKFAWTYSAHIYLCCAARARPRWKAEKHFSPYWFWWEQSLPHIKCHCWFHCVWPNGRVSRQRLLAYREKLCGKTQPAVRRSVCIARCSINSINADGKLTCWVQPHELKIMRSGRRTPGNEQTNEWQQIRLGIFPSISSISIDEGRRWRGREE